MARKRRVTITEYDEAALTTYSLGELELLLNLPPHQEMSKLRLFMAPSDIDIFDDSAYKGSEPPDEPFLPLVHTVWYCTLADSVYDAGSMILTMQILKKTPAETYDFLDEAAFADWILHRIQIAAEAVDRPNIEYLTENNMPITDQDLSIYPKRREDLIKLLKGGMFGYLFYIGHPSVGAVDPSIRIPINHDYALSIMIRFGSFNSDLFSSQEEIDAEKADLLNEFLDNMRLTYSDQILQQIIKSS